MILPHATLSVQNVLAGQSNLQSLALEAFSLYHIAQAVQHLCQATSRLALVLGFALIPTAESASIKTTSSTEKFQGDCGLPEACTTG